MNTNFQPINSLENPRFAGISTFFRLPYLTDPSGLDAAVLGIPFDGGQSYRTGSRFAPAEIRKMSTAIKPYNPSLRINPYNYLKVADLGDSKVNPLDADMSRKWIEETIAKIIAAGAIPISVGGDHSISFPILRALAHKYGPVGLIHIDSHLDTAKSYFGSRFGGGTPFRNAVEENLIDPSKWIMIGIRGAVYSEDDFDFANNLGVRCLTMDKIYENGGIKWILEQMDFIKDSPCYFTFDIDGLDPSAAPGTTMPVPGGPSSLDGLLMVRHLVNFPKVVGFDVVEVQPQYDVSNMTSILAATLAYEFLCTRAIVRRDGIDK